MLIDPPSVYIYLFFHSQNVLFTQFCLVSNFHYINHIFLDSLIHCRDCLFMVDKVGKFLEGI